VRTILTHWLVTLLTLQVPCLWHQL
jgi:hypothetical protein